MQRIRIFDTTLRDGEQSADFRPAVAERTAIATALDAAGVDVIELASSDDSDERLEESQGIAARIRRARVCCLAPLTENHLRRASEFLDGIANSRLHLYLDAHRIRALAADPGLEGEIFAIMKSLIGEARERFAEVEFSPQDATRTDPEVLARIVAAGLGAGADIVSISDTTGTATPAGIERILALLREQVPRLDSAVLSLHAHDHLGRAVENALAAIRSGVSQVEGTIGGVGPAGGNTDLLKLADAIIADGELAVGLDRLDVEGLRAIAAGPVFRR